MGKPLNKYNVGYVPGRYISQKGYIMVKVDKRWVPEHKVIWENANGPVPEGHRIYFKDRDKTNTALENLELRKLSPGYEDLEKRYQRLLKEHKELQRKYDELLDLTTHS